MKNENPLRKKYPYLCMWCEMMGSMAYYLDSEIEKAEKFKADRDVIYFTDDKPSYFRDVTSLETIHYFSVRGLSKSNLTDQEHEALNDRDSEGYNR